MTTNVSQTKPSASPLKSVILIGIALICLAYTIWRNRDQIQEVFDKPINPTPFVVGSVLYVIALLGTFYRWMLLVRAVGLELSYRDAARLGFIGNVFNLVIPGGVGGDVIKGVFFCRELGRTRNTRAISSIVLDRILGLMGLFLLGGVCGLFAWSSASSGIRGLIFTIWTFFSCGIVFLAIVFTPALFRPLQRLLTRRPKLLHIATEFEAMASAYRGRLGLIGFGLVWSASIHGIFVFIFFLISQSLFGGDPQLPSLQTHYVITPLVLFSIAIPIPFGALGVSEHIAKELFGFANYEGGAIAMMGFRVTMYVGGLVSLLVYIANLAQVRMLTKVAQTTPNSE